MMDKLQRPGSSEIQNLRGIELADRGWLEEALKEFSRAIELDPSAAFPRINRASVYVEQGRLLEALEDLLAAVKLAPNDPAVRYHLGQFFSRNGSNLALAELQRVLELDPEHIDALIQLGLTRADRGEMSQAEELLRSAVALDPADPIANHELGALLLDQGRVHEAISHLRFASDQMPGDIEILLDLGAAYAQAGFFEQGKQRLLEVIQKDSQNLYAHYNLASICARQKEVDQSLAYLKTAWHQDCQLVQEWIETDPMFDDIKKETRFKELTSTPPTQEVV
jgi:tetratricopeptide (TPR) repeat protein